jgi:putative nucleotidyltransferase with HDIG domain
MNRTIEVIPTSKRAKLYTGLIIFAGLLLIPYSFYLYFTHLDYSKFSLEMQQIACLIILCVLCRSLPIYIGDGRQALDVSVISIMAAVLTKGPYAAVVVYLISSLFTVDYDKETKGYHHLFNTPLVKTLFNNSNLSVSIILSGLLFQLTGGIPGSLALPQILWPALVFSLFAFLISSIFLLVLFLLDKQIAWDDAVQMIRGLVPNVLFAMPLGLIIALLFMMPNGHYLAILMLFPLLLARYSWSLYLESQVQRMKLIHAFVSAMEAKDTYTEGHSRRVETIAVRIAAALKLPKEKIKEIQIAALLHDIGKIGIEDMILHKPARLTPEERKRIEEHPAIGVSIVEKVGLSEEIKEMIRHHHERYDGQGYPDHLDHKDVSFEAYILGVADAFDAMTSDRPYRAGMSEEQAMTILKEESGKQFHPEIVKLFISIQQEEKERKPVA